MKWTLRVRIFFLKNAILRTIYQRGIFFNKMELNKNEYYWNWRTVFKFPHSSSGQVWVVELLHRLTDYWLWLIISIRFWILKQLVIFIFFFSEHEREHIDNLENNKCRLNYLDACQYNILDVCSPRLTVLTVLNKHYKRKL